MNLRQKDNLPVKTHQSGNANFKNLKMRYWDSYRKDFNQANTQISLDKNDTENKETMNRVVNLK